MLSPLANAAPLLRIVAAADLTACIDKLNQRFVEVNGAADIRSSITSSGNAVAQIRNGAPFDLFLSADIGYPQALAAAGAADPSSIMIYAHGRLAMVASDSDLDLNRGFLLLTQPETKRIAIANPEVAPYGRAAKAALQQVGIWDRIQTKMVFGDNVAQTAQFVSSGNADIGLIGAAHVPAGQSAWIVPQAMYPVIEQAGIVTTAGAANPLAPRYLQFLRSSAGRNRLQQCGFGLPAPADGAE